MNDDNMVFNWLPCSVVLISTAHEGKRDIMTATAMFVSEKEPLVAMSIAKNHLTDQLIEKSGEFILAIASEAQKDLVWQLGSVKGEAGDKFTRFSISALEYQPGKALIPERSAAWMACQVVSKQDVDGYRLLIARVVDQKDLGNPPLVWQKNELFTLKSL
ncbi:MAG: flavin reductase family protein [Deltaproteobacteria bacterium]|nr:MAG: flavin reductase family protein [Deltaproteobacteria bacterium]